MRIELEVEKEMITHDYKIEIFIKADVSKKSEVLRIKKYINKNYNKLDILVNNAAFT